MPEPDDRVLIVSADGHAGPRSIRDYRPFVEASYLAAFDDYVARIDAYDEAARPNKKKVSFSGGATVREHEHMPGLWDPAERAGYLDAEGIAAEVVFPQGSVPFAPYPAIAGSGPGIDFSATTEQRRAGATIYNRWLSELCSSHPGRHVGVAVVPIRDIDDAVATVERAAEDGLAGGISLPALIPNGDILAYNDAGYDKLWRACEANHMVLNLHGGANQFYGTGPEAIALVLAETDWLSHRALWFLIFTGVLERFPSLHVAVTEQRTHWVAPMLAELDSIYDSVLTREVRAQLPLRPSEYFERNVYIGASFMSRLECQDRHSVGVSRLMWGSDYPHNEGTWPWTKQSLQWTFAGVDDGEVELMLGRNAISCYRLDAAALADVAARIGPPIEAINAAGGERPSDAGAESSWAFRVSGPFS